MGDQYRGTPRQDPRTGDSHEIRGMTQLQQKAQAQIDDE
jgi:hypothetical protein